MTFKMNRSIIKGTKSHKASIAKAKAKSIVAQTKMGADKVLVAAGSALGQSYIPSEVDYSITVPKISTSKEETEKTSEDNKKKTWTSKDSQEVNDKNNQLRRDEAERRYQEAQKNKKKEKQKKKSEKEIKKDIAKQYTISPKDLVLENGTWVPKKGAVSKEADRAIWDGEQWTDNPKYMDAGYTHGLGRFKSENITVEKPKVQGIGDIGVRNYTKAEHSRLVVEGVWNEQAQRVVLPEEHNPNTGDYIPPQEESHIVVTGDTTEEKYVPEETKRGGKPKPTDFKDRKNPFGGTETSNQQYQKALREYYKSIENQDVSVMQMRDDKIWKFAKKGGTIHKNMRKSGYTPLDER